MRSKLMMACMAVTAFAAFAIAPGIASATNRPAVIEETTKPLVVSHESPILVVGTHNSTSLLMTNAAGETLVKCETATMTGELETNAPNNPVEGTITTASFKNHEQEECTGIGGNITVTPNPATNGLPWCLRSTEAMNTDEFQVRGNSCTKEARPIRFILDITGFGLTCTYERNAAIPGTFTTHPEDAVATITKVEFGRVAGGFLCPATGFLDLSFTLETENGTPLTIENLGSRP